MQMGLDDLKAGGGDCRAERDLLRRAAEAEATARGLIEKRRQELVEQRLELEARVQAAEEELEAEKVAALALGTDASLQQSEGRRNMKGLTALWPELEEVTAELRATEAKLDEVRAEAVSAMEAERQHLEASSAVYRLYANASGIRWDTTSSKPEGYVALDSVRHFSTAGMDAQETADTLWETIEACLPANRAPPAAGGA